MFKGKAETQYQNAVTGTWGEFVTPAGRVGYVLTKARLGRAGTDNERRLTSQLRPVREVLDPATLDFNQLLQRDLDDHRVATELLPYVLRPSAVGPGFFPPIMTVLLPFDGPKPVDDFPAAKQVGVQEDDTGARFNEIEFGEAFSIGRLVDQSEKEHRQIKLGRVRWNDELAKLVVLDGQHRAMALIAIDRTVNKTWEQQSGTRFRHFYEHRVRSLLQESGGADEVDLERIEIPVVVCWFPDLHGKGSNAHKAARKLFVDVNKEARQPSEARLTLLSDSELINIFTRSMLNRLREDDPPLPLCAIEYDNPEKDAARPVRWSVLTNLTFLKYAVQYTVFGPERHVQRVDRRISGGRPSWFQWNKRMRQQLRVNELFTQTIEDGDRLVERERIGNREFPHSDLGTLTDEFMGSWGAAVLHILGELAPYKAHCKAISQLDQAWSLDNGMSSLAHDALYVGVGMYWTLKDSHQHWRELVQAAKQEERKPPPRPEIATAWEILDGKSKDFESLRADAYLGRTDPSTQKDSKAFFNIANTHACQLGALLRVWNALGSRSCGTLDLRRVLVAT